TAICCLSHTFGLEQYDARNPVAMALCPSRVKPGYAVRRIREADAISPSGRHGILAKSEYDSLWLARNHRAASASIPVMGVAREAPSVQDAILRSMTRM